MASLTSSYLLPAVLLNPIVILHGFNTFCSHFISATSSPSNSPSNHQWLENLGPAAAPGPYFDVHNRDQLCLGYTFIMVLVQILAYGKVNDTRGRKKSARAAAKAERERKAAQKDLKTASTPGPSVLLNGKVPKFHEISDGALSPQSKNGMNGNAAGLHDTCAALDTNIGLQIIEDSTTDPSSEEETMA